MLINASMTLFALSLAVWLISLNLTWWLSKPMVSLRILDYPNTRSLHSIPVPRTGGVAIMIAMGIGGIISHLIWNFDAILNYIAVGTLVLAIVSFWDDMWRVPPLWRLLVQILAAALLPIAGLVAQELKFGPWELPLPIWLSWIFTIFLIVWMTNLYNFMDGIDGLAGGMAVIGFGTMAILGWQFSAYGFAAANAIISAAAGGFLFWNFPPARIFMGDSGSVPLGYLAAAMAMWGEHHNILSLWAAGLLFSPFIIDATITILRRLWNREYIFNPHCTHYYQRLVRLGWGHRKTVLYAYMLMLVCSCGVLLASKLTSTGRLSVLLAGIAVYGLIAWFIDLWIPRNQTL